MNAMKKNKLLVLATSFCCLFLLSANNNHSGKKYPSALKNAHIKIFDFYYKEKDEWVTQTLSEMSLRQKIGQLFMVAAYSNKTETHQKAIEKLITDYEIGGLIFFQGGPVRQAKLTNYYQSKSKIPLLIGIDAEWGLGMRLDSTISYPRQMTLGAIADEQHIFRMGAEVAYQLRRIGTHVNFAPVIDINSNRFNPVIGTRSFGENKEEVAKKGAAYMKGMQANGIIANAKHFPGHGDTNQDSHHTLPVIKHDKERISDVELYPFKALIKDSLMSMMVAHLHLPKIDPTPNRASTLSPAIVKDLLREELGFKGLIFTDALDMKGVSQFQSSSQINVQAFKAGNDVLLFPIDVPNGIDAIEKAIKNGEISEESLDQSVRRILEAKFFVGLNKYKPVKIEQIHQDINRPSGLLAKSKLYQQAATLLKNEQDLLPFTKLENLKIASVCIGQGADNVFQEVLGHFAPIDKYFFENNAPSASELAKLEASILASKQTHLVVSFQAMSNRASESYGISAMALNFIRKMEKKMPVIVIGFGNPYAMKYFDEFSHVICAYDPDPLCQAALPELIFGLAQNHAKLPVTASKAFPQGTGLPFGGKIRRLGFTPIPEQVKLNSQILAQLDSIALEGIEKKAYPGCQILVAKDGKIAYLKNFGHQDYQEIIPITNESVFDLASITKVSATLQAFMMLYDQKKVSLDDYISAYLEETKDTNKEFLVVKNVLAHQAGLVPFIPYWLRTQDRATKKPLPEFYSTVKTDSFPHQVAANLYTKYNMADSLWAWTLDSKLNNERKRGRSTFTYTYSDLSFYIIQKIVERVSGEDLDVFLNNKIYKKLGLSTTCFRPTEKHSLLKIVPTEVDNYFRHSLVHGFVHDQGAALFKGVAGHAGLFSNAVDLAKIMQMNLQNGIYGTEYFFSPETLATFNKKHFRNNRRGLGWDKAAPGSDKNPVTNMASSETFGHTGFTGTCVWVDPVHNLIFIFLSNRVHPSAENKLLMQENIRGRLHAVVYKSLGQRI